MKVAIINHRYFVSGGPERYLFNLKALLEFNGHAVIPYSVLHDENVDSSYSPYFAKPIDLSGAVYFGEHRWTLRTLNRTLGRTFYSREVERSLDSFIKSVKPDVAIVLHFLRKLSPSVLVVLDRARIPFVVRLSDFGIVCPDGHLFRDGNPCELCLNGSMLPSVKHRCVQGSLGASLVSYAAARFHKWRGFFDLVPRFIVPSRHSIERLVAGGMPEKKLVHLPTFVWPDAVPPFNKDTRRIVYVGRLTPVKGVHLLLEALNISEHREREMSFEVVIAGQGEKWYEDSLRRAAGSLVRARIEFVGDATEGEVRRLLRSATASVVPSLWYDNQPNAALESMAVGTPVIAPAHGCFPEMIDHDVSGLLFAPGDPNSLSEAIEKIVTVPGLSDGLGRGARAASIGKYSPRRHYDILKDTLNTIMQELA